MAGQDFFQTGPNLQNQYENDQLLRSHLRRVLPEDVYGAVQDDLVRLGGRAVTDLAAMGDDAELHPPRLVNYDPWGRRIDSIETAWGWRALHKAAAEEGIVASGYERREGVWSRVCQFAKLYLYGPPSANYSCPLAMTDGAARLIEVHGDDYLRSEVLPHLISRDPGRFWTSGQWMTERIGGSDVGQSQTYARHQKDRWYGLYGDKWFTSATTSEMTMTLARVQDDAGNAVEGSRGLSLFFLRTRDDDGRLNQIRIHRLKDKLGTKALPTAELTMDGSTARLVGGIGEGVRNIATLFNITRIYNAVCSAAFIRRSVALARDYAVRRSAFGKTINHHPAHRATLAALEVEFRGAFALSFYVGELLGRVELGETGAGESELLRLLTPIAKLYTAKQAVACSSEVLECFGGAGYVEDTGLPRWLRDAQVLPIWEGTTNVLSLDVLRALERDQVSGPFVESIKRRLSGIAHPGLADGRKVVTAALGAIAERLSSAVDQERVAVESAARSLAFSMARVTIASLLLEHAQWSLETGQDRAASVAALRWCEKDLAPPPWPVDDDLDAMAKLSFPD